MEEIDKLGYHLRVSSLVEKWDVNNIPLRPVLDEKKWPAEHARLAREHETQRFFCPYEIDPLNIGSNDGLLNIFRDWCEAQGILHNGLPSHYAVFSVDCNIYKRLMKVCSATIQ